MKVDMNVEGVSIVLKPENDEERAFLKSWWINSHHGAGLEIVCRFRNTKTDAIGLRIYKKEQVMLRGNTK